MFNHSLEVQNKGALLGADTASSYHLERFAMDSSALEWPNAGEWPFFYSRPTPCFENFCYSLEERRFS
jgi:hypothetical protein